jgi:hypothetical protein
MLSGILILGIIIFIIIIGAFFLLGVIALGFKIAIFIVAFAFITGIIRYIIQRFK